MQKYCNLFNPENMGNIKPENMGATTECRAMFEEKINTESFDLVVDER